RALSTGWRVRAAGGSVRLAASDVVAGGNASFAPRSAHKTARNLANVGEYFRIWSSGKSARRLLMDPGVVSKGVAMSDSLSDTVRCAVAQPLDVGLGEIRSTHRFERDLGLQPLDIVQIALRLEEVEDVELPIDALDAVHRVADLTTLLRVIITNDV